MKIFGRFIALFVVVLVVLVFARNVVIKAAMETGARVVAGMPLSIQKFDLDILHTAVDIEGLVLKNPSGFHDTVLVDIPKILVAYKRAAIFSGKIHLKNIEFDMAQFTVVKNEKGELNLDRLKALQGTQKAPARTTTKQEPKAPAKAIPIQIDLMRLKIGKVVYVDYSNGSPSTKEFLIDLDQSYQNITDLNSVVRLIVLKAMMSSGISHLVNFDIGGLEGTLTGSFNIPTKMAAEAAAVLKTAGENPSALVGQSESVLKSSASAVKSVASSLKNKLKFSF